MALNETLAAARAQIEAALEAALPKDGAKMLGQPLFNEAVRHAIKVGGKRVRPTLTLLCADACKATPEQREDALRAAVAIEFLHSYTLVHDDLPAMDNDTERRGAPTVWAKYGEGCAVLVGDFLQALAFEQIVPCRNAAPMLRALALAATQVIRGQVSDIAAAKAEPSTWDPALLGYVFTNKTAMLIATACCLGAIAAEAPKAVREALFTYGTLVGLAFQYVDDLLDAQQSTEGNELNALAVYDGEAEAVRITAEYCTREALKALEAVPGDTAALADFARSLLERLA